MNRRSILRLELPLGLAGALLVTLAAVFAATGIPHWIPPALTVRLGVASPLTGMTRSFVAMVTGDVASAFAWNPLGPILFAACVGTPVVAVFSLVRARRIATLTVLLRSSTLWLAVGALTLLAWAGQIVRLG